MGLPVGGGSMSGPGEPAGNAPARQSARDDDSRSWRGAYLVVLVWLAVQIAALTLLSWAYP
jgi:hypothetical protein